MRTSTLLLAAMSAAAVYAAGPQSAAAEAPFPTPSLTPKQQSTLKALERDIENFKYVDGYSDLMEDFLEWQDSYMVTQTAIPTSFPVDAPMDDDIAQKYAQNAIEQVAGMAEVAGKKQYMKEDNQLSFVSAVEAYMTLLSEVAEGQGAQPTATAGAKDTTSAKATADAKETDAADASTGSQADKKASATSGAGPEATGSAEEEEEQKNANQNDEDSSAGRISSVGALAAMLVAGLVAVVAL